MTSSADAPPESVKAYAPDDFLQALGAALLAWQVVENSTYKLFHSLLAIDEPSVSGAVFFTPDTFSMKLKLVDNLAKAALAGKPELLADWRARREGSPPFSARKIWLMLAPAKRHA